MLRLLGLREATSYKISRMNARNPHSTSRKRPCTDSLPLSHASHPGNLGSEGASWSNRVMVQHQESSPTQLASYFPSPSPISRCPAAATNECVLPRNLGIFNVNASRNGSALSERLNLLGVLHVQDFAERSSAIPVLSGFSRPIRCAGSVHPKTQKL